MSDDQEYAIVVIAMLGNVFSPHYARARAKGPADPLDHVTMNVALYGPSRRRWALTERRGAFRSPELLAIGSSSMRNDGDALVVHLEEVSSPLPMPIRGTVRLEPEVLCGTPRELDAAGRHQWWPIAPRARVKVRLDEPSLRWEGHGYFDANAGDEPLEDAFASWSWSRMPTPGGAFVSYVVKRRDGSSRTIDASLDASGAPSPIEGLVDHDLRATRWWRLPRSVRAAASGAPEIARTLEDTPFYARSAVAMRVGAAGGVAIHESLSLDRFRSSWVKALLPARMRREAT